jgi:hypothetical protein
MNIIYTDSCHPLMVEKVRLELSMGLVLGINREAWTLNDAMSIITHPNVIVAVINSINEFTVLEMAMLHFMCKPIVVTSKSINSYPVLANRIVDFIEPTCNLLEENNSFIEWFKRWQRE